MIPYLLAVAGGYLIGNSMNENPKFDEGGVMAKGGEVYKIQQKYKYELQPKWEDEKFQTGGRYFLTFKEAQDFKKKLSNLSSSMEYKVVKVIDDYADGGVMANGGELKEFRVKGKLKKLIHYYEDERDYDIINFDILVMASNVDEAEDVAEQEIMDKYLLDDYGTSLLGHKVYYDGNVDIIEVV